MLTVNRSTSTLRRLMLGLAGFILGFVLAGIYVNRYGGDAGMLFLLLGCLYGLGLAVMFNTVAELAVGTKESKKVALLLLILLALIGVGVVYHHTKQQPRYCNGGPVSRYRGSLPTICQTQ